eukprot:CAMPEP_0176456204 /NCGR_PEP_ID=MMETSP0127-20121128/31144_1 /TAXON_ID=938130 /ORGANISM="Platyophrya macrostoma, Strain WH" /LENGTH=60 /DNA_ID=CAMNT_0017846109 /DNA_START=46 /DNA_END=224 /DNA_ORIENTATION=+
MKVNTFNGEQADQDILRKKVKKEFDSESATQDKKDSSSRMMNLAAQHASPYTLNQLIMNP